MHFPPALDPVRSLGATFRLVGRSPAALLVGGLILAFFQTFQSGFWIGDVDSHDFERELPGRILLGGCCGILGLFVWSWIGVGVARAVAETRARGASAFEGIFQGSGRFGDALLALFLHSLAWLAAGVPFLLVVIGANVLDRHTDVPDFAIAFAAVGGLLVYVVVIAYVLLGLAFVPQEVLLGGRPAIESFRASWELARGKRFALFVYHLALFVFTAIGFCCLCVGVLFTSALAILSTFESWLELTQPMSAAPVGMAPPSPAPFTPPPPPPFVPPATLSDPPHPPASA